MAGGVFIEGIWSRYPSGLTDKNFTIKRVTSGGQSAGTNYQNSIYMPSIASAGAAVLGSGGSTVLEYTVSPFGSQGYEINLVTN